MKFPVDFCLALLIGITLLLGEIASAQPNITESEASGVQVGARPSVWLLKSKKGNLVLLGSVHVGQENFYPFPAPVEAAFESASALVVELNIAKVDPSQAALVTREHGFFSAKQREEGQSLTSVLGREENLTLNRFCEGENKNLCPSAEHREMMRPWLLALHFANAMLVGSKFDTDLGVDRYFITKAGDKPIVELESLSQQLNAFSSLAMSDQSEFLLQALLDAEQADVIISEMVSAWRQGDDSTLEKLVLAPLREAASGDGLYRSLIVQRNLAMAASLQAQVKAGETLFVVVGAGHLLGDQGLIKLLQAGGFSVEKF